MHGFRRHLPYMNYKDIKKSCFGNLINNEIFLVMINEIQVDPNKDVAWSEKAFALNKLQKYEEELIW